jgi:acyl-CoA reductase-like NAD-dependent aldehyde dehydrogenase
MADQASNPGSEQSLSVGSPSFGDLTDSSRATSWEEIDQRLAVLVAHKDEWVRLRIPDRLAILDEIRRALFALRGRWVAAELDAKGLLPGSFGEAEEWTILATVFRAIRVVRKSLVDILARGSPKIPGKLNRRPDGQVVVPVFPFLPSDHLLFMGVTGEARMEPGVSAAATLANQASAYRQKDREGKVALALGAGNVSMLPVADLLHKLFVELQVVIVKLNPVNAHIGPLMEEAFNALVARGYLAFVYGGKEVGSYLCQHTAVDELHMTGSDKTYEAVVFGGGPEGKVRKARRQPVITKRFTGELGNVSPVIIVPARWQPRDVDEQAKHICTWLVANAGFGCLTPRVIIQHRSWPHRQELMQTIGRLLQAYPTRRAYYPGSMQEHAQCLAVHPGALQYGEPATGHLPWTVVPDIDPGRIADICFKHEIFCGLLAETAIDAPSVPSFLDQAVAFANTVLWGTLNATLIVHPDSLQDKGVVAALERAITGLRYGTVSLNMLAYYSAYFMTAPWGAFPGHDIYDIQSGVGKTFNFLMLDRAEKSVIRAPFYRLDPITIQSSHAPEFCRMLAEFEAYPAWWKLPMLTLIALRARRTL